MFGRSALCALMALSLLGCSDRSLSSSTEASSVDPVRSTTVPTLAHEPAPESTTTTVAPRAATTTSVIRRTVNGTVISAINGAPLTGASVAAGQTSVLSAADGTFTLTGVGPGEHLTVTRPVWQTQTFDVDSLADPVVVAMQPVVVRALRVSRWVAPDRAAFDELLALTDATAVNALVFDTKDEEDTVLYDTEVAYAHEIGAVEAVYDPAELLARARERGLYTITRIVTFEDSSWADANAGAKLAGAWVDAANQQNWTYPIDLAVEACAIGFDEIQFDYVRFPAGRTAVSAAGRLPATPAERSAVIAAFLDQARARLHPLGCGVSAAIFGIVMSSGTDEGIGQTPETVSAVVDAVSPMLYPSHFSPGWLGFDDPNEHPGPVIAHGLDTGAGRMAASSLMRPWLQGFHYDGDQILSQIHEAEARGAGWIIWNAAGTYSPSWLPPS